MREVKRIIKILISCICILVGCTKIISEKLNYKDEMKNFIKEISETSKEINDDFIVIIQNAEEVIYDDSEEIDYEFLSYIDGIGKESLFYGYEEDNEKTPEEITDYSKEILDLYRKNNKSVLVTDYCSDEEKVLDAYNQGIRNGYISFVADKRELNDRPIFFETILEENHKDINSIAEVRSFLYLINPSEYESKAKLIEDLSENNYDLIIMDLFLFDEISFTEEEVKQLKIKKNGSERLVISYLSIGEAESYRYYWSKLTDGDKKRIINAENEDWEENYLVSYWDQLWKDIIIENDDSYIKRIIDAGFDGVYLDVIDAYEFYQEQGEK